MKKFFFVLFLSSLISSCTKEDKMAQNKALYDQKCAACHIIPSIDVLPKRLWDEKLLPEVAAKMGILEPGYSPLEGMDYEERKAVIESGVYGSVQIVTPEEWAQLRAYILEMAPDSLAPTPRESHDFHPIENFEVQKVSLDDYPGTYISYLSLKEDGLYFADLSGGFYQYNHREKAVSEYRRFDKPVVWYEQLQDGKEVYTEIGKLDPSEQVLGKLWEVDQNGDRRASPKFAQTSE
jgi:hypothetical protein